jgi:hypothetical protein
VDKLAADVYSLKLGLEATNTKIDKLIGLISNRSRSSQRTTTQSKLSYPVKESAFYNCGEKSHFAKNCKPPRKSRSPSPQAKISPTFDMRLYQCKIEPQNLLINVKVNGKPEKAIVDTAAQISVINREFANSLTSPLNIGKDVTLKGV